MTNVEVLIGEEVRLECQIVGRPRPRVEWLCDGSPVQGPRFVSVCDMDGTNLLLISPVTKEDDAEFECRATNPVGTASSFADIYVEDKTQRVEVEIIEKPMQFAPVDVEIAPEDKNRRRGNRENRGNN